MKKILKKDVIKFLNETGIDISNKLFNWKDLMKGMNVELEHGRINKITNVTNDNVILTGKIALAHLLEFPDYYERLEKLEEKAKKYWKNKNS